MKSRLTFDNKQKNFFSLISKFSDSKFANTGMTYGNIPFMFDNKTVEVISNRIICYIP